MDNGSYHNQVTINPFSTLNAFLNFTVRKGSHFDQTKIRLRFNNLLALPFAFNVDIHL
ncbi:MAG: hypothetical protein P4L10_08550 [Acidobacteriaceae bacterium]|jgi:iron complex outermembrane receptor protein|nr:hypothetical protein [Acidobacteriaceae bacterium]